MNLFNFKKVTYAAGTLLLALTTQQAFAWGYLYCTPDSYSTEDWEWAVITDDNKKINPSFNDLAYEYKGWDGKRYVVINGPEQYHWDPHNYWSLNVPTRTPLMNAKETKAFCTELKSFCPSGKPYVAASQSEYGQKHVIWIPGQKSPELQTEVVYDACS